MKIKETLDSLTVTTAGDDRGGLLDFAAAIQDAVARYGRAPHVLLGNGFSRAFRDDIFAYNALFDRADFAQLSPSARKAFDVLGTSDFETVIRALRRGADLLHLYGADESAGGQMKTDADGLREVLVKTIADNHPAQPNEISDEQYAACRAFLANFQRIYTLNYDLLLYWALMHDDAEPEVACDDGFRASEEEDAEYVVWDPASSNREQNIYYVHGGLHLFDAGTELTKYTWSRTGVRLIDQVRLALGDEHYPLFVAEGTSDEKLDRIRHHSYLGRIERSIVEIGGALFMYGVSCSDSDRHVLDWLSDGKIAHLYVGIFGDPTSAANMELKQRVRDAANRRHRGKAPVVSFFDASSARVWG
jgi:hypothetical protein